MATKLRVHYDRIGDILYITKVPPYVGQDSTELDDYIVARLNPDTDEVEGLEILFWSKRLESGETLDLPVVGERLAV
jgi:uncharacterized protein YuzE